MENAIAAIKAVVRRQDDVGAGLLQGPVRDESPASLNGRVNPEQRLDLLDGRDELRRRRESCPGSPKSSQPDLAAAGEVDPRGPRDAASERHRDEGDSANFTGINLAGAQGIAGNQLPVTNLHRLPGKTDPEPGKQDAAKYPYDFEPNADKALRYYHKGERDGNYHQDYPAR